MTVEALHEQPLTRRALREAERQAERAEREALDALNAEATPVTETLSAIEPVYATRRERRAAMEQSFLARSESVSETPLYDMQESAYDAPAYETTDSTYELPVYDFEEATYDVPGPVCDAAEAAYGVSESSFERSGSSYDLDETAYEDSEPLYEIAEPAYEVSESAYEAPVYEVQEPVYETRRARRAAMQLEEKAAYLEEKASFTTQEPVYVTRRQRREAEEAAKKTTASVQAISTSRFVPSEAPTPSKGAVAMMSSRGVRIGAGAACLGVAAAGGAIALTTQAPVASADSIAGGAEATNVFTVSGSASAPKVNRTDTVKIGHLGSATVANLAGMPITDPKNTYANDLSGTVQFPFPSGAPITDFFGMRTHPVLGGERMHYGIDLTPGSSVPVGSIAGGRVVFVDKGSGHALGVHVIVEHVIDGESVFSVYAHLEPGSVPVAEGDEVGVGDTVGKVGNTGVSSGPHLHLEVRVGTQDNRVDPLEFITSHNNSNTVVEMPTSALSA